MTKRYTVTMTFDAKHDHIANMAMGHTKKILGVLFGLKPTMSYTSKELPGVYDHNTLEKVG